MLAQAAAIAGERMWIEKVVVDTRPRESAEQLAARGDALADLQAILAAADSDPDLLASLKDDFDELLSRLPPDISQAVALLEDLRGARYAELVRATVPSLLARVGAAE